MDNRTEKRKIGDLGEDIACKFLSGNGFIVVDRNYLKPFGEIDIVCRKSGMLYFVEVKTVSRETLSRKTYSGDEYRPEDNVHPEKVKRLSRAISVYLDEKEIPEEQDWQLCILTVILDRDDKSARVKFLTDMAI